MKSLNICSFYWITFICLTFIQRINKILIKSISAFNISFTSVYKNIYFHTISADEDLKNELILGHRNNRLNGKYESVKYISDIFLLTSYQIIFFQSLHLKESIPC